MLTHVVCMKFASLDDASEVRRRLLSMDGRIESLRGIEAGVDETRSERSHDLVLITRHDDAQGLADYAAHPVHQEVLAFIKTVITGAVAVDFTS